MLSRRNFAKNTIPIGEFDNYKTQGHDEIYQYKTGNVFQITINRYLIPAYVHARLTQNQLLASILVCYVFGVVNEAT